MGGNDGEVTAPGAEACVRARMHSLSAISDRLICLVSAIRSFECPLESAALPCIHAWGGGGGAKWCGKRQSRIKPVGCRHLGEKKSPFGCRRKKISLAALPGGTALYDCGIVWAMCRSEREGEGYQRCTCRGRIRRGLAALPLRAGEVDDVKTAAGRGHRTGLQTAASRSHHRMARTGQHPMGTGTT